MRWREAGSLSSFSMLVASCSGLPNGIVTPPPQLVISSRDTAMSAAITGLLFAHASISTRPSDSTREGCATIVADASKSRFSVSPNGGRLSSRGQFFPAAGDEVVEGREAGTGHDQPRVRAARPRELHGFDQRLRSLVEGFHSQMQDDRAVNVIALSQEIRIAADRRSADRFRKE